MGQQGMVLVIAVSGLIFFCHVDETNNSEGQLQIHQAKLLGHCTYEQQGLIFSIGAVEPTIKVCKLENKRLQQV